MALHKGLIAVRRGVDWLQHPDTIGEDRIGAIVAAIALGIAAWPMLMGEPGDVRRGEHWRADVVETESASETLVAAYGGVTQTHSSDVHFAKPGVTDLTAHGVDWIGRPFKSPIYYGLRAMHWPAGSRFGGMIDFTHAKAISVREQSVRFTGTRNGQPSDKTATIGETFRHLEFSHGHNMLTFNGLVGLARSTNSIRPYLGVGGGLSLPHTEVQFIGDPERTYEYQVTGLVGQFVAGLEIRLPRMSVLIEYKFSFAPYRVPLSERDGRKGNAFVDYWAQFSSWWRGEAPPAGVLTTNLASHHLIVGAGWRHTGTGP